MKDHVHESLRATQLSMDPRRYGEFCKTPHAPEQRCLHAQRTLQFMLGTAYHTPRLTSSGYSTGTRRIYFCVLSMGKMIHSNTASRELSVNAPSLNSRIQIFPGVGLP